MAQTIAQTPRNIIRVAGANSTRDVSLTVRETTRGMLIKTLTNAKPGDKDGSYIIRGGDLVAPRRADENLRSADLIIVDGDSRFDPDTGEVTPGSVPIDDVAAIMRELGVFFVIHTTHSANVAEGFWKWRLYLIAAQSYARDDLPAVIAWLFDRFYERGCWINNVSENVRWSQPWFLPRCPAPCLPHFKFDYADLDAPDLDVEAIVAEYGQRVQRETQLTVEAEQPKLRAVEGDHSLIQEFNKANDIASVRSMLERAGYRFMYVDKAAMNGRGGFRYMRPGSESKTAGVVVFQGKDDALVFSHHGGADPLSGRTSDPFDVYTLLFHGGDKSAAARALMKSQPTIAEQINARHADGEAAPVTASSLEHEHFLASDANYPQEIAKDAKKHDPFVLEHWAALEDKPVRWLVKGIIPAGGFVALFGKPGTYKSFNALYVGSMVAAGLPCFGQPTEQTAVVYIAGEGGAGMRNRMRAIRKVHDLPKDAPIFFLRRQINLRSTLEDADKLIRAIEALGVKVGLLIIDTLARAFAGGNENASEDMGAFMAICAEIQRRLDCAVLVVHHSGKDEARGMRGHSSLFGAIDAELEVTRQPTLKDEQRIGQLKTTKQKDGEDGLVFPYKLDLVHVSQIDPEATSLVVIPIKGDGMEGLQPAQPRPTDAKGKAIGRPTQADYTIRKILEDLAGGDDGECVQMGDVPADARCVRTALWRATYWTKSQLDEEAKKKAWTRAITRLEAWGQLKGWGGYSYVPKA